MHRDRLVSTHLLIAAAYLEGLPQGRKLVLMAIADSGDEHTLESAPGLPKIRAWSGLSRSAALSAVKSLATPLDGGGDGLIERVSAGRLGRRAVYRVFPAGVPAIPHPTEVAARYNDPAEPVDNSVEEGPASKTLGSCPAPSRVLPAGPLQSYPSVSSAQRPAEPVEHRRQAGGFPGSRATNAAAAEDAQGVARRAHGANDVACTRHAGMIVPCGRCASEAADATHRKLRADEARRMLAAAGIRTTPSTTAQENAT